jgi:paraquat-inducible protein B
MSDIQGTGYADQPGEVPIKAGKTSVWDSASLVWAIPVIALLVALGAVWRNYNDQGPQIEISFSEAAGIRAQETQLRYRDISVGVVEEVGFSEDLEKVVVSIRINKELAPYMDSDARFWVVRPEVSARGVSGLDTVLSGVYIEGAWDNVAGQFQSEFEGLENVPLLGLGREGVTFTLRSPKGLPGAGTPILYKGVEVGAIGGAKVNTDGTGVTAEAVIYEPHTNFVTTSTRFWDISGFSFSLGATGARLNFTSLASLISGGVTFEAIGSGGTPLAEGAIYELFPNEEDARDDFLIQGEGEGRSVDLAMVFDENLSGLSAGAAVEVGGLRVGDVTSINGIVDPERFGDSELRLIASIRINPGRIGLGDEAGEDALLDYLDERIADGLRARLVNASLFTGGLKIELTDVASAAPATLDRAAEPLPTIPTAPADVADVGATAQGALQRVSDLPIEELMQSVIAFLDNASGIIGSTEMQSAPAELNGFLSAVRGVAESEQVQALPDQIGGLLDELQTTTQTLNRLVAELETEETIGKLTDTIENAGSATERLPDLVDDLRGILANAQDVPLADLSESVSDLLSSAEALLARTDALIAGEDVQAVPEELRGILASVRAVTEDEAVQALPARATELIDGLQQTAATLDRLMTELETKETVGRLTEAIDDVATAAEGLPQIVEEARTIVENAGDVPLDRLVEQVTNLMDTTNRLLDQESTRQLPEELNGALASMRQTLDELQEGGLVDNANATLASARDAADAIAEASATLPQLARDLRNVATQAGATLSAYSGDSEFTRETRGAIREIEAAARAIERLARTIERKPNSLILGR